MSAHSDDAVVFKETDGGGQPLIPDVIQKQKGLP